MPWRRKRPRRKLLDRLLGGEAVHQGVAIEVAPLPPIRLDDLKDARLVVVLDQVTDPHNVGAILRSAVAFAADAVVTTGRHAPAETGVLAKAASGALDAHPAGRGAEPRPRAGRARPRWASPASASTARRRRRSRRPWQGARIALVLGAEGKGLRRLTRDTCDRLARLTVPGAIASLNVSNAAVLALYLARRPSSVPRAVWNFRVPAACIPAHGLGGTEWNFRASSRFIRRATTRWSAKPC